MNNGGLQQKSVADEEDVAHPNCGQVRHGRLKEISRHSQKERTVHPRSFSKHQKPDQVPEALKAA